MGWKRYAKPKYGMIAGFLLLVGVIVPAVFGLLTEKAMELGTADLLDKSTNWDASNIANSTYFVSEVMKFADASSKNVYSQDLVFDSENDLDIAMMTTTGTVSGSTSAGSDYAFAQIQLNDTSLASVDKLVVVAKILDTANAEFDKFRVRWINAEGETIAELNQNESIVNSTVRFEVHVDAIKRLKLQDDGVSTLYVYLYSKGNTTSLENVIWGYRVELYDVKKVNATAISNAMLVVSGILAWVGAFAATPYWNPMKDPTHRDVRRVARRVRIRRRR